MEKTRGNFVKRQNDRAIVDKILGPGIYDKIQALKPNPRESILVLKDGSVMFWGKYSAERDWNPGYPDIVVAFTSGAVWIPLHSTLKVGRTVHSFFGINIYEDPLSLVVDDRGWIRALMLLDSGYSPPYACNNVRKLKK